MEVGGQGRKDSHVQREKEEMREVRTGTGAEGKERKIIKETTGKERRE